jgi:hypothetical protein
MKQTRATAVGSSGSTLTKSRRLLSYRRHDSHRDKEGLKA